MRTTQALEIFPGHRVSTMAMVGYKTVKTATRDFKARTMTIEFHKGETQVLPLTEFVAIEK